MGLFGVAPPISIYPGQNGTMFGAPAMPTGPTGLQGIQYDSAASGAVSRPVVIAPQPGGFPSTQRQIIWRVFTSATVTIELLANVDNAESGYVVIDTYTGTGNSGPRIIQADSTTTNGPQALSAAKIVSSARFFVSKNAGGSTVSVNTDITSQ